jgi:hypothetical protein
VTLAGDQDRIICGWLTGMARRHASQILSDGGGEESRDDRPWNLRPQACGQSVAEPGQFGEAVIVSGCRLRSCVAGGVGGGIGPALARC